MRWTRTLSLTLGVVAVAMAAAPSGGANAEQSPAPRGKSAMAPVQGEAAIGRLGAEIRDVAWRHGWSVHETKQQLRADNSLWLDRADNLFYEEPASDEAPISVLTDPTTPTYDTASTFQLHSQPGATRVIYLDFDGHTTSGTSWNSGATIVSAPFDTEATPNPTNWSASERAVIAKVWRMVAEDYAPFQIDVTTQDPGVEALRKTTSSDAAYGVRVIISPSNWYSVNAGGVAYINSFSWNSDTPVFVFSAQLASSAKNIAEASSHEAGHAVGLSHDGIGTQSYSTGANGWAPIMGVGYYESTVQWSRGEYAGATNTQDDLTIITGHAPFVADEAGGTAATAALLATPAATEGTISGSGDLDAYAFSTSGGSVTLTATPAQPSANVDLRMTVADAFGTTLAVVDGPIATVLTSTLALAAGTYVVTLDGVGDTAVPYSDYASIGRYRLTITSSTGSEPPPVTTTTTTTTLPPPTTTSSTTTTSTTTTTTTTTTQPPNVTTVRVSSVVVRAGSATKTAVAQVVLVAADGTPVAGGTVTGTFSGQVKATASAVTNASGVATTADQRLRRSGMVSFVVQSVTLPSGYTWDGVQVSANARL